MREIDRLYIKRPFFGTRKVREHFGINRKRAQRLMRRLGCRRGCTINANARMAVSHCRGPDEPAADATD
jgi:hypothetical protein